MILIDILNKIFGKKKKAKKAAPIIFTPPTETPTDEYIDPLTGEKRKKNVVPAADPNAPIYDKIVQSLSNLVGIASKVVNLRSKYQLKQISGNTSVNDRFKFTNDNKIIEANYQKAKEELIYSIKINCYQIETNYKLLTNFDLQKDVKSRYDNLKIVFNNSNFLPLTSYALSEPINLIAIEAARLKAIADAAAKKAADLLNPVGENPNVGGTQEQTGTNTGTGTTKTAAQLAAEAAAELALRNLYNNPLGFTAAQLAYIAAGGSQYDAAFPKEVYVQPTYPNWQNKSYLTSEYVIYNGYKYKNGAQIIGNNNNTPDKDIRWANLGRP
jgi:hypothetical protein